MLRWYKIAMSYYILYNLHYFTYQRWWKWWPRPIKHRTLIRLRRPCRRARPDSIRRATSPCLTSRLVRFLWRGRVWLAHRLRLRCGSPATWCARDVATGAHGFKTRLRSFYFRVDDHRARAHSGVNLEGRIWMNKDLCFICVLSKVINSIDKTRVLFIFSSYH